MASARSCDPVQLSEGGGGTFSSPVTQLSAPTQAVADVIISARNEETRIDGVIRAAAGAALSGQVIVAVNGSRDGTAERARTCGVETIETPEANKGHAVLSALERVGSEVVLLLDADLLHITPEHVDSLIAPALLEPGVMTCGILPNCRGQATLQYPRLWFFSLSGQRALETRMLRSLDPRRASGYRIEVALNSMTYHWGTRVVRVSLDGVEHVQREKKEWPTSRPIKWWTIAHCYAQYRWLIFTELPRFLRRRHHRV